ncbi:MAG: bifunctional UDP-N-acetylglucosamine diphosphorylase/glucosamine-1-phosphate N-acetyltransferase GlmU, partial [Limnobacter sp.]|nr:bifunctional UDP-N-acetylglucosamine diphosphorylase/glucosamine-1-phosphate N-acetyltransferase GlmU [Limnobacter sp.]
MNIVILAAGKGTRMKSNRPKVIHPIGHVPMVVRVVQAARHLGATQIILVVGHQADQVKALFEGQSDILFVEQTEQLGTGHAVRVAASELDDQHPTLVLYGDVPLIHPDSLAPLVDSAKQGAVGLLTQIQEDPTGYGRIVRNSAHQVTAIVEQKDASTEQLAIQETNTGIVSVPTQPLKQFLQQLSNDNAQGEYYLTDIIEMASQAGLDIQTAHPRHDWEVLGINSRLQQAELERILQRYLAEQLMAQGVELADPSRIDVRGSLACGQDVRIDVNCVFEGAVKLADGVSIGPNCYLKNVNLAAGVRIEAFSHLVDAVVGADSTIG